MIVVRAEKITKTYGGTVALDGVNLDVHSHKVNVLIGENGAGKSTLMRILAGIEQPTSGRLMVDGKPARLASVREATARGIGIVHQELNLCANLSVAENIFLTRGPRAAGARLDRSAERKKAHALLSRLGQNIDPDTPVSALRIGQQQIIEIAKVLASEARVLIMDEPTSALSASEVDILFGIIAELKQSGVAIVYISHRLEELMRIGDIITVLRDGKLQATAPIEETSISWIVEKMLGRKGGAVPRRRESTAGPVALTVTDMGCARSDGAMLVDGVSAGFRAGEITAIYGLLGSGKTELLELIYGARRGKGTVKLHNTELSGSSVAKRVKRHLLMVPEDRQRQAIFQNLSVGANLTLSHLSKLARLGVLRGASEAASITEMIKRFGVKAQSGSTPIMALSGGNQQKVVIGRCLMACPAAILMDEPSRGIDIGARAEIYDTIASLAARGIAVMFATADMVEALTLADRILVMAGGKVTADFAAGEASEEKLVKASHPAESLVERAS